MKYIKINAANATAAKNRAEAFSKLLMTMARPNDDPENVTEFLFAWVEGEDGSIALEVDDELSLPVRNDAALRAAVRGLKTGASTAELNAIIAKKSSGRILFKDLLPLDTVMDTVFEKKKNPPIGV